MLENKEVWKDIKGYEGLYQVSNKGRVWSVRNQIYLSQYSNGTGYMMVGLSAKNGKKKKELVHRLVALAFLDNPNHLPQVNHKDEVKDHNWVENLEWCDAKYNNNYGNHYLRCAITRGTPVRCVETGKVYYSARLVEKELHITHSNVLNACKGVYKTAGGYHWEYAND